MSADGRFIAFNQRPINTPGGRPGDGDVLLYDRLSAAVTPIAPGGAPTISADGGSVAFLSAGRQVIPGQIDANGFGVDVFLYSRATRKISLASHAAGRPTTTGNGASSPPEVFPLLLPLVSADGRYVAFFSRATNLVPRQATPGGALFLYDQTSGSVILASRKGSSPTAVRERRPVGHDERRRPVHRLRDPGDRPDPRPDRLRLRPGRLPVRPQGGDDDPGELPQRRRRNTGNGPSYAAGDQRRRLPDRLLRHCAATSWRG